MEVFFMQLDQLLRKKKGYLLPRPLRIRPLKQY
jgi:hypothetical protein